MRVKKIDECINNFNFTRVHRVMKFLDWKWQNKIHGESQIPTIGELVLAAQSRLEEANKKIDKTKDIDETCIASGGLKASAHWDEGEVNFELEFILADWDTFN